MASDPFKLTKPARADSGERQRPVSLSPVEQEALLGLAAAKRSAESNLEDLKAKLVVAEANVRSFQDRWEILAGAVLIAHKDSADPGKSALAAGPDGKAVLLVPS